MVACEMCGTDSSGLKEVRVAGTQMRVCSTCSKHGVSNEDKSIVSKTFYKKTREKEIEFDVVENYANLINSELGKKGLTSHQLARTINVKESSLNKYLSNKIKIDISSARKIEKFLEIKLIKEAQSVNVDDYMEEATDTAENSSFGDLLMKELKEKNKK